MRLLWFILILALNSPLYATFQRGDHVEYDGYLYRIDDGYKDTPLEIYFKTTETKRPEEFKAGGTNLWRGYIAIWRVHDQKLFLAGILVPHWLYLDDGGLGPLKGFVIFPLSKLFPDKGAVVFADWYSETMKIGFYKVDSSSEISPPKIKNYILGFNKGVLESIKENKL